MTKREERLSKLAERNGMTLEVDNACQEFELICHPSRRIAGDIAHYGLFSWGDHCTKGEAFEDLKGWVEAGTQACDCSDCTPKGSPNQSLEN